jgi:O-antigen/teichoic acid export membrane protein
MKSLLAFSLPLVPLGVMLWGNSFLDRYLILHFLGLEQVGIYAVTYSLAATTAVLYSVLGFTLYPELTRLWNSDDKTRAGELVRTGVGYYLLFLIPAIAILTMLGLREGSGYMACIKSTYTWCY